MVFYIAQDPTKKKQKTDTKIKIAQVQNYINVSQAEAAAWEGCHPSLLGSLVTERLVDVRDDAPIGSGALDEGVAGLVPMDGKL